MGLFAAWNLCGNLLAEETYMEERIIISRVKAESFLIKDPSLHDINAPFYKWLIENGFKYAWHKGHYECCDWVYVNITHKLYADGMPGIPVVTPTGNHAITIDEFFTIWKIYEKYVDKEVLVME
jgi:hypothetical protein